MRNYLCRIRGFASYNANATLAVKSTRMSNTEYHWSYQPPNFFEVIPTVPNARFEGEHIWVRIDKPMSEALRLQIEVKIDACFRSEQVVHFKTYALTFVGHRTIGDDGKIENDLMVAKASSTTMVGFRPDITMTGPDGVVIDTKAQRHALIKKMRDQIACHGDDATLRRMLAGYSAATKDSADELVHLFEVVDALNRQFRSRSTVRRELGLLKRDIDPLPELANDAPVAEGRHRGRHEDPLRPATSDELDRARDAARKLIRAYLDWLDRTR